MKEAKKVQVTDQICKQVQLMRKGGANQTEIAKLLGISAPTVSRIETAGFDMATYLENKRIAREKENRKAEEQPEAEPQLPGQMEMELTPEKPAEMTDQVKMMRFQAEMTQKLIKAVNESAVMLNEELDRIRDAVFQLIRAVRKE
jgi:DNA-binding XRE family transcriptional regulator